MANANGIISPPVSVYDIQGALGTGQTDVGSLCKHANINMWARFKPIYCAGVTPLKNSQRDNTGHVVTGYAISWGIMKPTAMSWSDYIDTTTGVVKSGKWLYDRPTGGAASPYRLTDFVEIDNNGATTGYGYLHQAVCPITFHFPVDDTLEVPYQQNYDGTVLSFLFTFQNGVTGWSARYCMYLADIFSAELDFYPTVIMTIKNGGRIYEYAKSGDHKLNYYTGNVDPYVQVLVNTKDICESVAADGGGYHTGPLVNGEIWTCCMVLTSLHVPGTAASHTVNSGSIRRLEYSDGADIRYLSVFNTTPIDDVTALLYTITITKSGSYYYVSALTATITTTSGGAMYLTIDASFTCLVGVIGGTGWSGNNQQESKTEWARITIESNERDQTITKTINANMPEFRFTGDVHTGQRIAAGQLTFRIAQAYLTAPFTFNVYDGASSYSQTIRVK